MVEPKNENPLTKLWRQLATNNLSMVRLYEFMKLAKLVIFQVIGSLEDEKTFSTLNFMKSTLWNQLVGHLKIAIRMFIQDFYTKETFPFHQAIAHWNDADKVKVTMNV
jgi:ABC-type antimicrobial peptide transport system permease subunit